MSGISGELPPNLFQPPAHGKSSPGSPEQLATAIKLAMARMGEAIKEAGIRAE